MLLLCCIRLWRGSFGSPGRVPRATRRREAAAVCDHREAGPLLQAVGLCDTPE